MKIQSLTLPEFTFIDHIGYKDDEMQGRQCIFHIRTATVMELIADDELEHALNPDVVIHRFQHRGESFTLALHYTFDEDNLQVIFIKAADWYSGYCDWEDNNIATDNLSSHN